MTQPTELKVLSRDQDPRAAEEAAKTIALAMSAREENGVFWVKDPKHYYDDWWATVYNYQLRMPSTPFIYTLQDYSCVAYAYWYPEQKPQYGEGEGPDIEGAIDTSSWERPEGAHVLQSLFDFLSDSKETFLKEKGPFLYLAFMSTHPLHQRKGLGSMMLKHVSRLADTTGKWMYLESSNDDNRKLYEKFGFQLLGRERRFELPDVVPGVHLTLKAMARPPQAVSGQE